MAAAPDRPPRRAGRSHASSEVPAPSVARATSPPPLTLLVDTNVILDVVLARDRWVEDATLLLDAVARRRARGYVAGHALTTVYYVVERERGRVAAVSAVSDLLQILTVVALGSADFQRALTLGLQDYEDAVQAAACLQVGAQFLVTRNPQDFRGAPVSVRSPGEVRALLAGGARA